MTVKYIKDKGIKHAGDIMAYSQKNKAAILAHSKAQDSKLPDFDIENITDAQKKELLAFLDNTFEKTTADSKANCDRIKMESKARIDKMNAQAEKDRQTAERIKAGVKPAATIMKQLNASLVAGDIYDNRRCDFGSPDSIHKMGDKVYIFSKNKRGMNTQTCVSLKQLKAEGIEYVTKKSNFALSDKQKEQLWRIENSI
jgi:hypothetical protein